MAASSGDFSFLRVVVGLPERVQMMVLRSLDELIVKYKGKECLHHPHPVIAKMRSKTCKAFIFNDGALVGSARPPFLMAARLQGA